MDLSIQEIKRQLLRAQTRAGAPSYVIIRSQSAGAFAGELLDAYDRHVTMNNVRRLWKWDGAATLSELAVLGTSKPDSCKFPVAVACIEILDAIEIIHCTEAARASIASVPVWTAH